MRRVPFVIALAAILPFGAAAQNSDVERAVATITAEDFFWRVGVIAHDSMMGRNTPSPGLDMTAEWIASEFEKWGLRGGAEDGGYIQRYPLVQMALDVDASGLATPEGQRLAFGDDILPLFGGVSDMVESGGLVLVSGSAGTLPEGALTGKHVVMVLGQLSTGSDRQLFRQISAMRGDGPKSLIILSGPDDVEWADAAMRALRPSVRTGWTEPGADAPPPSAPMLRMRAASLVGLLEGTGVDLVTLQARVEGAMEAHDVPGMALTLTVRNQSTEVGAPNVVGILDGSDPELRDEFVVFSGHMDHVGVGSPDENGDSIFNGADDDASGTVAVMEVAEAMASLETAPRRSMVFLVVSGEEKGLWGSEYFASFPTVPLEQTVANINTDMVGRNWPDTIVAIGKEHSDLGETLNRVNGNHPELGMTAIDDVWPEERFYYRSDHFNFAQKGVPVLFFFNGTHEDYHGRDDEPDRIDAEKAARIARLVFYLGVDIGNAAERPKWNPESYQRIVSDRQE
jgi:hypothetical protein